MNMTRFRIRLIDLGGRPRCTNAIVGGGKIERVGECRNFAKFLINGKPKCDQHARHLALEFCLAQQEKKTGT